MARNRAMWGAGNGKTALLQIFAVEQRLAEFVL